VIRTDSNLVQGETMGKVTWTRSPEAVARALETPFVTLSGEMLERYKKRWRRSAARGQAVLPEAPNPQAPTLGQAEPPSG
jgi:hypothetical protein